MTGLSDDTKEGWIKELLAEIKHARARQVNIKFAFLKVDFNNKNTLDDDSCDYLDRIATENDCHWKMYKNFLRQQYEELSANESSPKWLIQKHFVERRYAYMQTKHDEFLACLQSTPIYLDDKYLTYPTPTTFSGFVAVANIDLGEYYFGAFNHGTRTLFLGTHFNNINIKTQMQSFLDALIESWRCS